MKDLIERTKAQFLIDKKKTTVLGILFLVLVGVALNALIKKEPEATVAAPSVPVTGPAVVPVPQASPPSSPNVSPSTPAPAATAAPTAARRRRVSVGGMPRELEHDPFTTTAWGKFAPDLGDAAETRDHKRSNKGPFWSRFAESLSDYRKMRKAEVDRLGKELGELSLQSTLTGPFPIAYISGRLVREGDTMQGFSVFKISERRVFLKKDGQMYCLGMQ